MKLAAMFGSSASTVGMAAAGAVVVVAGAVGVTVFGGGTAPEPEDDAVVVVEEAEVAAPNVAEAPDASAPEPVAEAPTEAPTEAPGAPMAPALDVVRVDPDGEAVIAGRAEPEMRLSIFLDDAVIADVVADAAGAFVALLSLPPADMPRAVTVRGVMPDGVEVAGAETVLVAPFGAAEPVVDTEIGEAEAPSVPEAGTDVDPVEEPADLIAEADAPEAPDAAPQPDIEDTETAEIVASGPDPSTIPPAAAPGALALGPGAPTLPTTGAAPTAPTPLTSARPSASAPPAASAAPAVVIAGPEGLRIAQGPGTQPQVQTEVRLDAISYDATGAVILAGRGPATADIQVYLNNQPIQLGEIGPGGAWSLQLPDVDPGTYTLAVAELAEDGSVESRIETPFLREDPERVIEAPAQAAAAGAEVITVQPGFTLWGIARDTFGDGILYVQIFEENLDQIRDPDWIFPGQIFRLPDMPRAGEGN